MKRIKFEDVPGDTLKYGNPCRAKGHVGLDGKNIRSISGGACLACQHDLPPGLFTKLFEGVQDIMQCAIYATPEEAYEAHKKRVIKWQKDNPEKFRKYQKKYAMTEERKQQTKEWYANMPPERKEEMLKYNRDRQRTKYNEFTPEEKRAFLDTQKIQKHKREVNKLLDDLIAQTETLITIKRKNNDTAKHI